MEVMTPLHSLGGVGAGGLGASGEHNPRDCLHDSFNTTSSASESLVNNNSHNQNVANEEAATVVMIVPPNSQSQQQQQQQREGAMRSSQNQNSEFTLESLLSNFSMASHNPLECQGAGGAVDIDEDETTFGSLARSDCDPSESDDPYSMSERLESERCDPIHSSDYMDSLDTTLEAETRLHNQCRLRLGVKNAIGGIIQWATKHSNTSMSSNGSNSRKSIDLNVDNLLADDDMDSFDMSTFPNDNCDLDDDDFDSPPEERGLPRYGGATRQLQTSTRSATLSVTADREGVAIAAAVTGATSRPNSTNSLWRSVRDLYHMAIESRQNSVNSQAMSIIVSSRGDVFLEQAAVNTSVQTATTTTDRGDSIANFAGTTSFDFSNCSALSMDVPLSSDDMPRRTDDDDDEDRKPAALPTASNSNQAARLDRSSSLNRALRTMRTFPRASIHKQDRVEATATMSNMTSPAASRPNSTLSIMAISNEEFDLLRGDNSFRSAFTNDVSLKDMMEQCCVDMLPGSPTAATEESTADAAPQETFYKLTFTDCSEYYNSTRQIQPPQQQQPAWNIPPPRQYDDLDCSGLALPPPKTYEDVDCTGLTVTDSATAASTLATIATDPSNFASSVPLNPTFRRNSDFQPQLPMSGPVARHSIASNTNMFANVGDTSSSGAGVIDVASIPPATHFDDVQYFAGSVAGGTDSNRWMNTAAPATPSFQRHSPTLPSEGVRGGRSINVESIPPATHFADVCFDGQTSGGSVSSAASATVPTNPPNKVITDQDISPRDVLFADMDVAKGGVDPLAHEGTMLYFNEVQQRQAAYAAAVADTNKLLAIRKELIKYVADRGGRYLKLKSKKRGEEDTPNQWTIIKDKPVHTQLKEDLHVKVYITDDITELDFIVGRGGHGQSHPGNQAYLDHKDTLRQRYLDAKKNKDLKHEISKELVHWLQRRGGRFLKQDRVGWYIMSNEILYEQAKQKLNEPRKGRTEI